MDSSQSSFQSKERERKDLYTTYVDIQDILMQPLRPLVHLVGFQQSHPSIIQIILEAIQANSKNFKQYNLQSYEFYDSSNQNLSVIYRENSRGDRMRSTDIGFLKYSFFRALVLIKPAVTILVFDWQTQPDTGYDWKIYEAQILNEIKQHQDKCMGARQSKMVLLVFLPLSDNQTTVDEKLTSLKRATAQRGDDNIKTFFLMTAGFESLRNISKKFVKNLNDLCFQYYRDKKFIIKKKQKKLIKEQIDNIRYSFRHGIYSSFTKQDWSKPVKYMKESYTQLRQSIGNSGARTSYDEKRENADLITIRILQQLISNSQYQEFMNTFRSHFYSFQTKISILRKEQRYEELKWRANWMRIIAQFFEMHPHPDEKQELFAGYYNLNSMLIQISRKQEFQRLQRISTSALANQQEQIFDIEEMKNQVPKYFNLIGRDPILSDLRDPLGGSQKQSLEQKLVYEKYKLYCESRCDVDSVILELAQKCIQQYKNKSRQLKGESNLMFKRINHFISYHVSEYVIADQESSGKKTQKYRSQIARSLIVEGWIQEALKFVEKAKLTANENLELMFQYEMEILNYDRELNNQERYRRFTALLAKMLRVIEQQDLEEQEGEAPKKPLEITGFLIGPQLVWISGNFDLPTVQVNTSNKLHVELHSKLEDQPPIKIKKIILRFNESSLNQEISGDFSLAKGSPIILDRSMYISLYPPSTIPPINKQGRISKENQIQRDYIQFTEVYVEIANGLGFVIKPYLKPQESLLDLMQSDQRRVAVRAKEPIKFNIEAMPTKVKFGFQADENGEQALLGDYYNVFITMEPEDITISEFALQIESVDMENNVPQSEVQLESQNLMVSQMLDSNANSTSGSLNSSQTSALGARIMNVQRDVGNPGLIKKESYVGSPTGSAVPFSKGKSLAYKDIEIFYQLNPQNTSNNEFGIGFNNQNEEDSLLQELDYTNEDHKLELPTDCKSVRLAVKFYNEAVNTVNLLFGYTFTQNSDSQKLQMKQLFRKQLNIRSQSPFRIEWEIKNADPYLQSLKIRNEQLQMASLVAPLDEDCWLNCIFISQSLHKVLYLNNVSLDIVEKERVRKVQSISMLEGATEPVRMAPGEGYETIFKIRASSYQQLEFHSKTPFAVLSSAGKLVRTHCTNTINNTQDEISNQFGAKDVALPSPSGSQYGTDDHKGMPIKTMMQATPGQANSLAIDGNNKLATNYLAINSSSDTQKILREIDQFADLQFNWYSQSLSSENVPLLNSYSSAIPSISCTLPSPLLTLIEVPVKMRFLNESSLQRATLYEPFSLELEIENQSESVIEAELNVEECDDFYIGGELKAYINLMPFERYNLKHNIIPLQIGRLSLPKFNLLDASEPEKKINLIKSFTKKCLIVK